MKMAGSIVLAAMVALPVLAADIQPTPLELRVGQKTTVLLHNNAGAEHTWKLLYHPAAQSSVTVELRGAMLNGDFPAPAALIITGKRPGKTQVRVVCERKDSAEQLPLTEQVFAVRVTPGS